MIHNISENNTLLDLAHALVEASEINGYNLLEQDDHYILSKQVFEVDQPYSIEVKSVFEKRKSKKRDFMILIIKHMLNNLFFPDPSEYIYYVHENEDTGLEENWNDLDIIDLENAKQTLYFDKKELEDFTEKVRGPVELFILEIEYQDMRVKKPFTRIMDLLRSINNYPITMFLSGVNNDEGTEFTAAFRIEYNFDNVLTEEYVRMTDETINNNWFSEPVEITRLGEKEIEFPEFMPYVELMLEMRKIIENEFD